MFEEGDIVIVKNNLKVNKNYDKGCTFVSSMEKFKNKTMEIESIEFYQDKVRYILKGGEWWYFSESMLQSLKNSVRKL